jgi:acetyl-CoA/propionyl-CoA carboxylase biotin carboxyl carrier protein
MFERILIANRGEIAVRVARTCRKLGVSTVGIYSDVDSAARHVAAVDDAIHLPGSASTDTYLNVDAVLAAAKGSGAQAIHPGYGFLSENADFAEAVIAAGLVWIGPPPGATRAVGDKIKARRLAESAGVPVVPGITEPLQGPEAIKEFGERVGYPVAVKAAGGGGGRGLKVAHDAGEVDDAFASARREAEAYFNSSDVFVERYLAGPKHLEVQILAPQSGAPLWLGVRDCSLQRRHQKLVEETPPPLFGDRLAAMGEAAVAVVGACGYINAGTVELLVDDTGDFYFLEVNARLQVEHTVTEEVFGVDLVACQLRIASGEPLGFTQADLAPRGHAIECRVNAEDPALGFIPGPGRIERYQEPSGSGIRVDSGYGEGDEIPAVYDSLVAKLITWAEDREGARIRMIQALHDFTITGVPTTIPAHLVLLGSQTFIDGAHTTRTLESDAIQSLLAERDEDILMIGTERVRLWNPGMAASAPAAMHGGAIGGDVVAPMQGTILKILIEPGSEVAAGDPLVVLEAMKMETVIAATGDGTVKELLVAEGDTASAGQVLVVVE